MGYLGGVESSGEASEHMSFRSRKLIRSAKGQSCVLGGFGFGPCQGDTVSAHINSVELGSGTGIKAPDCFIMYLCQHHHDVYDGRKGRISKEEKAAMEHKAYPLTVQRWFDQGIVEVK